ncbi:MAG: protein translocase subunit SecD [Nakamurella sp.]
MASPSGQFHPWRLIITFAMIVVVLYGLVFFTAGSTAPKLGIDLQGGTRVTLLAKTTDGSTPSRDSMKLARTIMERRVNGSGVSGAQIQIDGSNQLVITAPGQNNLEGLTRSAQMNIRAVVAQWPNPALVKAGPTSGTATTGATAGATTGAISTGTAVASATAPGGVTATVEPQPTSSAAESSQGFREAQGALAPRAVPSTGATDAGTSSAAVLPTSAAATPTASDGAATATSTAKGAATTGGATAPQTEAPAASAFPAGSNPDVLTQPKGSDTAAITAWEAGVAAYSQKPGSGPSCAEINYYQGLDDPKKPLLSCDQDGTYIYLLDKTLIPGTEIKDATSGIDTQGGHGWVINVDFKSAGFKTWAAYTTQNYDRTGGSNPPPASRTAFTLDGQVLSAPVINEPITTPGTMVSGSFTQQSAKALADSLKFGALPLAFDRQESEQVSAELGIQYLKAGLIAGGIGLALVVLYCLMYYRLLGLVTILSLFLSGVVVYAVMVLLGRWIDLSLDMAGIAGLIIAIGITADSFVVYFERIKDEVREGRTFRSSVPRGWTRARKTILSADAVSFLSAAILYILAVGDVKGFAFTLGLSTVLDLLVVFLVTHPLVALMSKANLFSHPIWSGLGNVALAGQEQRAASARLQVKEA